MGTIQKFRLLHLFVPIHKFLQSLRIQGSDRLRKVSVMLGIVEVYSLALHVGDHPREYWVLT